MRIMTIWTLSLSHIERVFGQPANTDTITDDGVTIVRYFCPQDREVWQFFEKTHLIGGVAFYHDEYITHMYAIHVKPEFRQQGWSKKMFAIVGKHYGPLAHSEERTDLGRRFIKNEH